MVQRVGRFLHIARACAWFCKNLCKYLCRSFPQVKKSFCDNSLRPSKKMKGEKKRASGEKKRANVEKKRAMSTVLARALTCFV